MNDYDYEDNTCCACSGTGISATGRVEDSCSNCNGQGYKQAEYEPDEPDEFFDEYLAEKVHWAGSTWDH